MSLFEISGKTVLVTGGAHGLGRMIAAGLVQAGADVLISSRKADASAAAVADLQGYGRCEGLVCDLGAAQGARALADQVRARRPRLHVLINNAGRSWGAPLESFPDSAWESVMTLNVQVPFALVRELRPLLREAATPEDPARVINVGSAAGMLVERLNAYSYAASKAALHHLSRVLAAELAGEHIAVNAIAPGYFPTRMTQHLEGDARKSAELVARIPFGRLGRPQDIAGLCVFLVSQASAYMTGAVIALDGGLTGCR